MSAAIVWLALLFGSAPFASTVVAQDVPVVSKPRPDTFRKPVLIEFKGDIDYQLDKYFQERLSRARRSGADLIILEIDSNGGYKTVSLDIAEQLRDIDWAYTVAWIPQKALSGGALIALGCDEIVGNPNMRFGDIGEIQFDPEFWAFRLVPAKVQSVLVRQARDLATAKSRPPELAEALIDKDVQVFVRHDENNQLQYRTVRVGEQSPDAPWTLIEESGAERFLTVSGSRGLEIGLIEHLAGDRNELLGSLSVEPGNLTVFKYSSVDSIVYLLNSSMITALLIVIGMLALYLELSAPGIGVGAVVSSLCALLFFGSRFLGGTAGWLEVTLFMAGVAMIAMEVFVIPGWGVSGIGGLALVVASAVLAGQSFIIPENNGQWNQLLTSLVMLVASGCIVLIGAAWITRRFGSLPVFNQMVLAPRYESQIASAKEPGAVNKPPQHTHPLVSVGDWGRADSPLRPSGRVRFAGRSVDVISDGSFIEAGQNVKVVSIQGSIVKVVPATDENE